MICPHCGKDTSMVSELLVDRLLDTLSTCFNKDTFTLIKKCILSMELNRDKTSQLLSALIKYPEPVVYFSVNYFLQKELDKQGKSWEYLLAIVRITNKRRQSQKNQLPALPK